MEWYFWLIICIASAILIINLILAVLNFIKVKKISRLTVNSSLKMMIKLSYDSVLEKEMISFTIFNSNFNDVVIRDFGIYYRNQFFNFVDEYMKEEKLGSLPIIPARNSINYKIDPQRLEKFILNPTGKFLIGGFTGDAGLTGRKIIVDTYGGYARHGGGAFSGKDPTKVDRSAAYMARYIAKNVVAANMCDELEIQLSYAIGVKEPTSIYIDTKGTEKVPHDVILEAIKQEFDLTPAGIIHTLNLRTPIYKKTASYGHFGRPEANLPWEQLDKVENLKKYM